jgi:adenine-specific DNA-methyltransferase
VRTSKVRRFSELGQAGIGYVSGANDFFHLRPSEAQFWRIPSDVLRVSVRKAEQLPERAVDKASVRNWLANDEPVLLLNLRGVNPLPAPVSEYLETDAGRLAKNTYKCRNRRPWYAVPDVKVPDAFLSYMSGVSPNLVANEAQCVCSNSVHAVRLRPGIDISAVQKGWASPPCQLSCEIEGHPLGGGMLKLEPGEAANVRLPVVDLSLTKQEAETIEAAIRETRRWRHYA